MPVISSLLATTHSQTVHRQAWPGVVQDFAYSPFGSRPDRAAASTPLGFNGQWYEPVAGGYLLGNGHRLYNPALMRFTRPDALSPFGKGGLNSYAYCEGDPVNGTDSSGKFLDLLFPDMDPNISAVFSIFAGLAVVGLNLGTGLKTWHPSAPKLAPLSKIGANISMAGGLLTFTGGVMRMAGVKEGSHVSAFGALVTGTGATLSAVQIGREITAKPQPFKFMEASLRARFLPAPKAEPPPVISILPINGRRIRMGESAF